MTDNKKDKNRGIRLFLKRITKIGVFFIILMFILNILGMFITPKWSGNIDAYVGKNIRGYQAEKENSLDVVFTGNSYLYKGLSPMELYDKSGITSYNYCCPGQRLSTAYYYIKSALETQTPKVVFHNVDAVLEGGVALEGNVCRSITCLPMGTTKFEALFDKNIYGGRMIQLQCFFPILGYHDRVRNLEEEDIKVPFVNERSVFKGFAPVATVDGHENDNYMEKELEGFTKVDDSMDKYFSKIQKLCKEKNVEYVLIEVPCHNSWNNTRHKAMKEYADKKNIKFIDMNCKDTLVNIDWEKDSGDLGEHLNTHGAMKVTSFMNDYLKKNYDLKDHRNEKGYEEWEEDLKEYHKLIDGTY